MLQGALTAGEGSSVAMSLPNGTVQFPMSSISASTTIKLRPKALTSHAIFMPDVFTKRQSLQQHAGRLEGPQYFLQKGYP